MLQENFTFNCFIFFISLYLCCKYVKSTLSIDNNHKAMTQCSVTYGVHLNLRLCIHHMIKSTRSVCALICIFNYKNSRWFFGYSIYAKYIFVSSKILIWPLQRNGCTQIYVASYKLAEAQSVSELSISTYICHLFEPNCVYILF